MVFGYLQRSVDHSLRNTALFQLWIKRIQNIVLAPVRTGFCTMLLLLLGCGLLGPKQKPRCFPCPPYLDRLWTPFFVYQKSVSLFNEALGLGIKYLKGKIARLTPVGFPSILNLDTTNPCTFLAIWTKHIYFKNIFCPVFLVVLNRRFGSNHQDCHFWKPLDLKLFLDVAFIR